ncbi:MAG: carboxypeptidase regulatory-like domain-containing protein, partial [Chloroflexota bacterium]
MFNRHQSAWMRIASLIMLMSVSVSCTWSLADFNQNTNTSTPTVIPGAVTTLTPVALAEITFTTVIPAVLNPGESLTIGILDEVTGLGLNPVFYAMTAIDDLHFTVKLPFTMNSVIKYRYYRQGTVSAIEDDYSGKPVRYRLFQVTGPAGTDDIVSSWSDTEFSGGYGKIDGVVIDKVTNKPIPNIMVSAGGQNTLTDSLGQYIINGLPAGTHLVSAYALDGAYSSFQQGASVAVGLVTTAPIQLDPVPFVNVTFKVSVPTDTVPGAPVRIAGNLLQLGNTFADLQGGVSTIWSRMPALSAGEDGRLNITLKLPAGADVRYKYTLGDGFWNAEHAYDESFLVRQLIVPGHDLTVQDSVSSWQAGKKSAPILFDVTVPANTPAGETVSIQFKPFGWTEALPMWSLGNNHWVYKLYGPLNMLGSFSYRYCRSDQCGSADDIATAGIDSQGRQVSTSLLGENIQETVTEWKWWPEAEPGSLVAIPVNARGAGFWAGAELSANYSPGWLNLLPAAVQNMVGFGSNFLVLTPGWTVENTSPLNFAPIPGKDALWSDVLQNVQTVKSQNLNTALYATPKFLTSAAEFWAKAPRTPEWWNE